MATRRQVDTNALIRAINDYASEISRETNEALALVGQIMPVFREAHGVLHGRDRDMDHALSGIDGRIEDLRKYVGRSRDRDLARFLSRDVARLLAGPRITPAQRSNARAATVRAFEQELDRPLVELLRTQRMIVDRGRQVVESYKGDSTALGHANWAMAAVMHGFAAIAVTSIRLDSGNESDSEESETGLGTLERVEHLDEPLRLMATMSAVESLLELVQPFRDEATSSLTPHEWVRLDTASRTLELQVRAAEKNVVILSAAFADVLAVIQPHLIPEQPTAADLTSMDIVADATGLGTDDSAEFGGIARDVLRTAAEADIDAAPTDEAEDDPPSAVDLARRGFRSAIEPAVHELTTKLIVGAPGAVATITASIVAFVKWGTLIGGSAGAAAAIAVRFVAGLVRRSRG